MRRSRQSACSTIRTTAIPVSGIDHDGVRVRLRRNARASSHGRDTDRTRFAPRSDDDAVQTSMMVPPPVAGG
jgi:hypothetical protein